MRKYNLKAIHNSAPVWLETAKLLKTNAKVQFESNSQLSLFLCLCMGSCWRPMRKYNLKAIHNNPSPFNVCAIAVEDQCESTIWKQFTTLAPSIVLPLQLLKTNAKVQFESNSQQVNPSPLQAKSCWRPMRKYNLKAIHNPLVKGLIDKAAVEDQCESTIWKQFTTQRRWEKEQGELLKTNAKVQFESNSQQSSSSIWWTRCCWRPMRKYNLKAIHNSYARASGLSTAVEDQCESTIWKQFTTQTKYRRRPPRLLKTNAKVQFESNSQQKRERLLSLKSCWRPMRKYNLKAIHNRLLSNN